METDRIKSGRAVKCRWYENSYGRKRGYVCLFDLRDKNRSIIDEALLKFYFLNPGYGEKVVFLILNTQLYPELIDYQQAHEEVGFKEKWIPYVECWYPRAISLNNIEEIMLVNIAKVK